MTNIERILAERGVPTFMDGVKTKEDFKKKQDEIRNLLLNEQYGTIPPKPDHMSVETISADESFAGGSVTLKRINLIFEVGEDSFSFPICSAIPKSDKKLPAFVSINFNPETPNKYMPTEEICDNGFAVFSFCYSAVTSDDGNFKNGIAKNLVKSRRKSNASSKISLWAWAAMRVMDYVMTLDEIDHDNVAVVGHSRLGKTALLTGACDDRFRYVISNDSGCCGAAIERGKVGERYKRIAEVFPFWFCPAFVKNAAEGKNFDFDQNFLLSLSVPRTVIVGSAECDSWADPVSEFLGVASLESSYARFGKRGLVHNDEIPVQNTLLMEGEACYFIRTGSHYFTRRDWNAYMTIIKDKMSK